MDYDCHVLLRDIQVARRVKTNLEKRRNSLARERNPETGDINGT